MKNRENKRKPLTRQLLAQTIQILEKEKSSLERMLLAERRAHAESFHEIKTHAKGILWGLSMLQEIFNKPDKTKEWGPVIKALLDNTIRYRLLLNNMALDIQNKRKKKMVLTLEDIPVSEFLHLIDCEFGGYLQAMGNLLQLSTPSTNFTVKIDKLRLFQVIGNILLNASEHGSARSISVYVKINHQLRTWQLFIKNGYDPNTGRAGKKIDNLGLGQTICRKLMAAMKGAMYIMPVKDNYTVILELPVIPS